ncbi:MULTISPECIES: carbohydrate ABC transporter permease [unclassified Paenibacillus]|uniref:carbohydrate ABC transporter permease n=1 Tax=unclassified Paenibacillus TaxID=185978 RepID=UPI000B3C8477|nr:MULTISPECIES: carbohydrate ABC transporter permease [unclassified Paenibacillus]QNK57072.1 carbohydrate ABC transporter permease [Paenibacillus sp. PAMC21692]
MSKRAARRNQGIGLFEGFNYVFLFLIAIIMTFPFLYVFSISISSYRDYLEHGFTLIPKSFVLDAYEYILASSRFVRSLFVTVEITVIGTLVNLLFTTTFAYVLARPIIGQRIMMFLVVFTMMFSAGMIPTYLVVKGTGLLNSIWALIIPAAINSFNLVVVRQFFLNIPRELSEAATIDGANDLHIFAQIMLPLSKPALAAFGLFYAVAHWNNYFTGILYLNDPADWPIQVILRQMVIVNEPLAALNMPREFAPPGETVQMAATLVATLPILILYPFLQKHFVKGVMLGSVKG